MLWVPYYYVPIGVWALPFEAIVSLVIYFTSPVEKLPKYKFLFYIVAFFICMLWLYYLTNSLMDLLNLVGLLTGINPIILGVTVLAWGNSSGGTACPWVNDLI